MVSRNPEGDPIFWTSLGTRKWLRGVLRGWLVAAHHCGASHKECGDKSVRSTRPFNTAARGGVGGTREGSGKAFSPRHSKHYSRSVYSSLPNSEPSDSVVVLSHGLSLGYPVALGWL